MTIRPSVRLRLTLLYGALFLLAGALLLAVNYGLVRSRLGPEPVRIVREAPDGAEFPPDMLVGPRPLPGGSPEAREFEAHARATVQAYRAKALRELLVQSGIALGLMSVVSVGLGWMVAGRVLRPLHRITATARQLSETNLHERIAMEGPQDELKELADTFDDMLARLDASFEAQRRFIANASHELRTPLAIQRTLVDVALAEPDRSPDELSAVADDLRAAIDRSERLIDALLLLARSERQVEHWEPVDVAAVAADAVRTAAPEAAARRVRLDVAQSAHGAVVRGDPALIERAVANLVENAVRHNVRADTGSDRDTGAWAQVAASVEGGMARVCVSNSGPVVDEAELPQLFEPFRRLHERTGSANGGSGLGLSIVRAIAQSHDGEVRARPRAGGGLEVELLLPLAPRA